MAFSSLVPFPRRIDSIKRGSKAIFMSNPSPDEIFLNNFPLKVSFSSKPSMSRFKLSAAVVKASLLSIEQSEFFLNYVHSSLVSN